MGTSLRWVVALVSQFLTSGLKVYGGEFPDAWTWDDDPKVRAEHAALEGKAMPALHVTGWVNGQMNADEIKCKVVVVNFYATWCGPCMATIPHNNEMLTKYKDQGLRIIGVCTHERGQEKMEQTAKERKMGYPTARDPELKSQAAW